MNEKKEKPKDIQIRGGPLKPVIYTIALIVFALAILVASSLLIPRIPPPGPGGFPGAPSNAGSYFLFRGVLSVLNVALVVSLIFLYVRDYLYFRSSFTLGLVAFLFSFLLYALSTFPMVYLIFEQTARDAFLSFVPMLFSAIGLLIFLKLSRE